jgi:hypothetical protein
LNELFSTIVQKKPKIKSESESSSDSYSSITITDAIITSSKNHLKNVVSKKNISIINE